MAALAVTACVSRGGYEAEVARQRALSTDLVSCKKTMLDESKSSQKLLEEKKSLDAERAALLAEVESQRAGVDDLREKLERERMARLLSDEEVAGSYRKLTESLDAEVKSGQIQIEQLPGRLQIRAADQILFDSGSADLKPEGRAVIGKVARSIKGVANREVRVEGHTDDVAVRSAEVHLELGSVGGARRDGREGPRGGRGVARSSSRWWATASTTRSHRTTAPRTARTTGGSRSRWSRRPRPPRSERARAAGGDPPRGARQRCTPGARWNARSRRRTPGPGRSRCSPPARPRARWRRPRSARWARESRAVR